MRRNMISIFYGLSESLFDFANQILFISCKKRKGVEKEKE